MFKSKSELTNMKGLILFANHFEEVEAILTIDMLRRASISIDAVSITNSLELTTQQGLVVKADKLYQDVNLDDYDFLIIPGGKAVFETHLESSITKHCVEHFNKKNQLIACICAAPMILGKYGLLKNRDYVCFPSCENDSFEGRYIKDAKVVVVDNIITSKAAGTTFEFSYEIIKYLISEEKAKDILNKVYY